MSEHHVLWPSPIVSALCRRIVCVALLLLLTGCILEPKASQPVVRGTWKGRATPVQVTDIAGVKHDALELQVIDGPGWPRGNLGPLPSPPLLILGEKAIVPPGAFAGRIVTVSGTMGPSGAYAAPHKRAARIMDGTTPAMEFTIRLDREPVPID